MENMNFESVELGSLNLDGVNEKLAESSTVEAPTQKKPFRMEFLNKEGTYTFTINSVKPVSSENNREDSAGNRWTSIRTEFVAEVNGYKKKVVSFIDLPLDSAEYTKKDGTKSLSKFRYLASLMSAAGIEVKTSNIAKLPELLTGKSISANAYFAGDRISFHSKSESGEILYSIRLRNGGEMVNDDGDVVTFSDRDSALAYYKQSTGKVPTRGLTLASFKAIA